MTKENDNWKELPADKSLMSQPEGEHVLIGNIIVTSEIDEKLRAAADAYLKEQLPDCQIKRWIDDVVLERLKEQENWQKGTEVIIYCHNEDREAIKAEVECKGYKIAGYVSCTEEQLQQLCDKMDISRDALDRIANTLGVHRSADGNGK